MTNDSELKTTGSTQSSASTWRRPVALILVLLIVFGLATYFTFNPEALDGPKALTSGWIEQAGPWGWLVIIVMMILHSFVPLPAEIVAIAAGASYGLLLGTIIVWIGAMLGAIVAFALARWLGQPFVERILSEKYRKKLTKWRHEGGTQTLFLSRFIPVISFNLINYAAGLANVRWWTFLWTTAIGIIPITSLSVFIGASMKDLPINWILGLSAICVALVLIARWWFQQRNNGSAPNGQNTN